MVLTVHDKPHRVFNSSASATVTSILDTVPLENGGIAVPIRTTIHYLLSELQTHSFTFWHDEIAFSQESKSNPC